MKGVLLVNLGSPDSTDTDDVRDYLREFLMDERVIDLPKWFRSFLVKGIILKTRPKKSAKAYRKIWWDKGSPLIVLSEKLKEKVQVCFRKKIQFKTLPNEDYLLKTQ
jgi:ferrochelatase